MKAQLTYHTQFFIPEVLPHQYDPDAEYGHDICGDEAYIDDDGNLALETNCGVTRFKSYIEVPGGWLVTGRPLEGGGFEACATYNGAYNALNACVGVNFPSYKAEKISSSLGEFPEQWEYEQARLATGLNASSEEQQNAIENVDRIVANEDGYYNDVCFSSGTLENIEASRQPTGEEE